jgi:hypothetical protein
MTLVKLGKPLQDNIVEQELKNDSVTRAWSIQVKQTSDQVILYGRVFTFYGKQLVQEKVKRLMGKSYQVVNLIEVDY